MGVSIDDNCCGVKSLERTLHSMRTSSGRTLPPGQHLVPARRFGLLQSAHWVPEVPLRPSIWVGGEVQRPVEVTWDELAAVVSRRRQRSDLHCVATWSTVDLEWGGLPFVDVLAVLVEQAQPTAGVRWLTLTGHDGYRCCLFVDDARDDRVLLADELNGQPLPFDQGAPLRLVAPAQYGYKSMKHLQRIDFHSGFRAGSVGAGEHPRARVEREERSQGLPGWFFRPIYRALTPAVLRAYRNSPQLDPTGQPLR